MADIDSMEHADTQEFFASPGPAERLLDATLRRFITVGALEITFADGNVRRYGRIDATPVRVTLRDPGLPRKLLADPDLALGEAWMDGRIVIADDDLRGLIRLAVRNRNVGEPAIMRMATTLAEPVQRFLSKNPVGRSKRNVAHHYDIDEQIYRLFLDADMQYSCAYFPTAETSLDAAQEAKKHHIAKKLCLSPGQRVLDIGCGWGGMALTLARDYGVDVTGITLSKEQHRVATERAKAAGLEDRVRFVLQDYRETPGPFDRVVSVGMFEHVGRPHFRTYFRRVRQLLAPDGVALIHTIGNSTAPRGTSTWIRKYIFPGGYIPAMSEAVAAIEKEHLTITDVEVLRLHYAYTLRHWHDRFMARSEEVRKVRDDRFVRMWRYYLTAAEEAFRGDALVNFQFQITRSKDAVPLTRDYLGAASET